MRKRKGNVSNISVSFPFLFHFSGKIEFPFPFLQNSYGEGSQFVALWDDTGKVEEKETILTLSISTFATGFLFLFLNLA